MYDFSAYIKFSFLIKCKCLFGLFFRSYELLLIVFNIKCLFSGALTKSQFPVFTIYAQKSCLSIRPCSRAWCIDRVQNYKLNGFIKRSTTANSRQDCFEMCLGENEFTCRWVNIHKHTSISIYLFCLHRKTFILVARSFN